MPGGTRVRRAPRAKAAGGAAHARTVVYIHGILNKPKPSILKCQWDTALFGVEMGDRTRMAYWVNREYYPRALDETCEDGDRIAPPAGDVGPRALGDGRRPDADWLEAELDALAPSRTQRQRLQRLGRRLLAAEGGAPRGRAAGPRAKVLPLPPVLRRWVTRWLTAALLRDVHDFLFDPERRAAMKASLRERLLPQDGPFVVVGHSQGSMVAYDVLRELAPRDCEVPLFVTIGSPLGLAEVQDVFHSWIGRRGSLPVPACVGRWVNVADRLDPVAADCELENDFAPRGRIEDHCDWRLNEQWRENPHSGPGYLRTAVVRRAVLDTVGSEFAHPVRGFVIARDLVRDVEDRPAERHPVLIQLAGVKETAAAGAGTQPLAATRDHVVQALRAIVGAGDLEDAEIDPLERYVGARLTRAEVERFSARYRGRIDYVWRNAEKRALLWMSSQRIHAIPARLGYGAAGEGIAWAVLDTGIHAGHPHFRTHGSVERAWDCTTKGRIEDQKGDPGGAPDRDGHGTHVAGVIAGASGVPLALGDGADTRTVELSGVAPRAKLHVYKVLADDGRGRDSWIIKALDHVARVNEQAGRLRIHGVNLSLGGPFDPSVYGCGHSPLCAELRRLWRQGVLVCIAAGNEGYAVLQSEDGVIESNMDLSIGDPANLDEAIAVGSVHKESPHIYGVSYFSSRGPTADGRPKPDVVAPGERVLSARHRPRGRTMAAGGRAADFYVEMSGTSMATPHVSGLLAAFLSVRRELVGYPDRVKQLLLAHATDLGRDRYIQGRGLVNLLQMLAAT
jgi:subtilisin family serine protease